MDAIKTTTSEYLIQQVQSRFKPNNSNWRADALDWIGLMIGEIGYHIGYESKRIPLEVKNYKVKIPSEVVNIGTIWFNHCPLADATADRGTMRTYSERDDRQYRTATTEDATALQKETERLNALKELYLIDPSEETLVAIEDSQRKVLLLVEGVTYQRRTNLINQWYQYSAGYLKTSFEEGWIVIDADIYMLSEKGLPLVVDTYKYTEACIWGMMWYMMLQGYVHPTLSLQYIEDKKDFFVAQAKNEPKIMNISRHEQFTEEWSTIARGVENETLNNL